MYLDLSTLEWPVPDMSALRAVKEARGYADLRVSITHPRVNEPLIDLRALGIAGQPYYSRPQAMTGDPIPGIPPEMYVRRSLADILVRINGGLQNRAFTEFFGHPVELYVEEALRPRWLQDRLREVFIAELISRGRSGIEARAEVRRLLAPTDGTAPHASGGAVACVLRIKQDTRLYVPDTKLWLGYEDADMSDRRQPDYYEDPAHITSDDDWLAQRNRRALLAIMTGRVFNWETELTVNPSLIYQYNLGNRLWALCCNRMAYYDEAPPVP
jgi:hypothetical protein